MILVTGATGKIGRLIIREMTARSMPFRALVRSAEKGSELACPYVVGSFEDHESLVSALLGIDRVVLNGPVSMHMAEQQIAVIAAAEAAHVRYLVKISSAGADLGSDRAVNRQHGLIEQRLAESPIASTSLRPTYFMQNFFGSAASIRDQGIIYGAFGQGRLAFIDCEDIAGCAVALLAAENPREGAYMLTGPKALSFDEVADAFGKGLGRTVRYRNRPIDDVIAVLKHRGLEPALEESFRNMIRAFASGEASRPTEWVRQLAGRPPLGIDDFIRNNIGVFA